MSAQKEFNLTIPVISIIVPLMMCSCTGNTGKTDMLPDHNTVEKIREEWSRVEKPLAITVTERSRAELEAIGSIGVFLTDSPKETALEFHFDGEKFSPLTPVTVDSTVTPVSVYPYRAGLHPDDSIEVGTDGNIGAFLVGSHESTTQTNENINVKMRLKDITALLRLEIRSDSIGDILDGIELKCDHGIAASHMRPFNGEWIETRASRSIRTVLTDCMVNNGRCHDFHMVPTSDSGELTIGLKVNGRFVYVSTTVPPMREGSITELRLSISKGRLNIGSSWVDTKHPFCKEDKERTDSIKVLGFLQTDGTISDNCDDGSIAMVIETDGRHGKAVALKDASAGMMFRGRDFSTGHIFPTVDGQFNEGSYGNDGQDIDNRIAFNPGVRYSGRCAFGHRDGALLTSSMIVGCDVDALGIFTNEAVLGTAYIPSVYELARLSLFLDRNKDMIPEEFDIPRGFYTTSCESGEGTYYSVDPSGYRISAYNSKRYPDTKLRLYYLF